MHWEGWGKDKVVGAVLWRVGEGAMTEAEQGASCEVRGSQVIRVRWEKQGAIYCTPSYWRSSVLMGDKEGPYGEWG